MINIWHFQRQVSARLLRWASISMLTGGILQFTASKFWRGLGAQFAGWGFINALIALGGNISAENRAAQLENPGAPDVLAKETRNLRRLLWINAGLDVLYILGGWWWTKRNTDNARGNGSGVMLQGAFLLVFDVIHALLLHKDPEK